MCKTKKKLSARVLAQCQGQKYKKKIKLVAVIIYAKKMRFFTTIISKSAKKECYVNVVRTEIINK